MALLVQLSDKARPCSTASLTSIFERIPEPALRQLKIIARHLPPLRGDPLHLSLKPDLTAHRGRLLSGEIERGVGVHAAAFIRKREIVLERELLAHASSFRLILLHELFHFVWAKLGNPTRRTYTQLIEAERKRGARGELGESSSIAKLEAHDVRSLREYVCESFCDTGAWLYSGVARCSEYKLAPKWRMRRREWFEETFAHTRAF